MLFLLEPTMDLFDGRLVHTQPMDHLPPYLVDTNLDYPRIFYYPNAGVHTTFNALSCHTLLHCHISFAKLLA